MALELPDDLDLLLDGTADALDIPPLLEEQARSRYGDVGTWLARTGDRPGSAPWDVYPQGSARLGTMVQPTADAAEFDIDLVCQRNIRPELTTTEQLKQDTGNALTAYARARAGMEICPDKMSSGRRCWTLGYEDLRLHLDVLPAIPDPEDGGTGILLADRDLRPWQRSNPIEYAAWFADQGERTLVFKERGRLDPVPQWSRRTVLQRTVQVIKRHRDRFYGEDLEGLPPSILVTTLVAHAYQGETSIIAAVTSASAHMPDFISNRAGTLWVPNPKQPTENFADRWQADPRRRQRFVEWIDALRGDIQAIRDLRGTAVTIKMAEVLGREPVFKAADARGERIRQLREQGLLRAAVGTAMLGTGAGVKVSQHGFFGPRPRS